mmetsp:Transcript_25905/g.33146  ORF Transcript_25905/g.33146 Transcript_25905/m.33146 type:complete len:175 (-) Transcript_25905:21-545(-)
MSSNEIKVTPWLPLRPNKAIDTRPPSVLPTGTIARALTNSERKPAIAKGCRAIIVDARSWAPSADAGTLSTPFPKKISTSPPPKLLCLNTARGRPGKFWTAPGSAVAVKANPYDKTSIEQIIPANGPATANSIRSCLFFGDVLRVVMELVIPLKILGTKVGTDISNFFEFATAK